MPKVTWLGDGSDAETNEWNGKTFKKGEAVDIDDQRMIQKAKTNRFFKVEGDKSETVEDNPEVPVAPGRIDDQVENAAFAPQEQLDARREESKLNQEADPAHPKPEKGESRTFAERKPPKRGRPAKSDKVYSEHR